MSIEAKTIFEIADDFVLGLLDADEFFQVEARIETDPALAAAVSAARDRFLPLDLSAAPIAVTDGLWARIEQTLPKQSVTTQTATTARSTDSDSRGTAGSAVPGAADVTDAAGPGAAAAVPPGASGTGQLTAEKAARPAANDNLAGRWKIGAMLASAASLVLATGLGWALMRPVEPMVVAVLLNGAGEPQAIVEDFGNDTASIRLLSDFSVPADKVMQVWTLPTREMGPVSLGLLQQAHSATLASPKLPPPHDAQLYEITLEQTGGSPTGRPTGPILVKGFAKLPR
jgi:anti-sigma-K factor RskA